jgi:hypothetical protein
MEDVKDVSSQDIGVGVTVGEALGVGVALHGFAVVQLEQFTY